MGAIVTGLLTRVNNTDSGKLTRNRMASAALLMVCMGRGMNAQNNPAATPPAEERRDKCQMLGSCNNEPKRRICSCSRILWCSGMYRLKNDLRLILGKEQLRKTRYYIENNSNRFFNLSRLLLKGIYRAYRDNRFSPGYSAYPPVPRITTGLAAMRSSAGFDTLPG